MFDFYDDVYRDGFPGEFVYGDEIYVDEYYFDERWKPINGFCGEYWVSDKGRVWSMKTNRFLKLKKLDSHGHLGVCLYTLKGPVYAYIHRLVADAFIPNPNNYPVVRHIYDNPEYNEVNDLLRGTQRDNMLDARRNGRSYTITKADREKGLVNLRTPVKAINADTGEIDIFESQSHASEVLNIPQANIWKVLNGERRKAGGYYFEYIERGDRNGYN